MKFVIPMFLFLIFYLPLNSYSQTTGLEEFSEMTFSGNMTGVIKRDLPLNPSEFWYYLLLSFLISFFPFLQNTISNPKYMNQPIEWDQLDVKQIVL